MNFGREISNLRRQFTAAGDAARAARLQRQHDGGLQFLGCDNKTIRAAAKAFAAEQATLSRAQLGGFVRSIWQTAVFELRSAGIAILELRVELLAAQDLDWLEPLLRSARDADQVDALAVQVVGDLVQRFARLKKTLRRWAADDDAWLRRAALLALLPSLRAGGDDFALFAELAAPLLQGGEPSVDQAIGRCLCEAAAAQPEPVQQFLADHQQQLSALTRREAGRAPPRRARPLKAAASRAARRSPPRPPVRRP